MKSISYVIWTIGASLEAAILVVGFLRGLHRELPVFFGYLCYQLARDAALWGADWYSYSVYFYLFWTTEVVSAVLAIAVMQELFNAVFGRYQALEGRGALAFRWVALGLMATSIYVGLTTPGVESNRLVRGLLAFHNGENIVQVGLAVALFSLVAYYGLVWSPVQFGAALGFGIMAAIIVGALTVRLQFGRAADPYVSWLVAGAYDAGAVIWLFYAARRTPEMPHGFLPMQSDLQRWNEELRGVARA